VSVLSDMLARLEAEATPAPWTGPRPGSRYAAVASTDPGTIAEALRSGYHPDDVDAYGGVLIGESIKESDREFIAAARNALPSLLEYVELLDTKRWRLIVLNTGQEVEPFTGRFLGTVTSHGVVWHVWDGGPRV
jgi:hypothetical protein